MDTTARAVEELDLDLPEIMLTELRGQTFKTNQRFHRLATKRSHQRIQRRLASCVACLANPSQNLQGSQLGLFLQNLYHPFPETGGRDFAKRARAGFLGDSATGSPGRLRRRQDGVVCAGGFASSQAGETADSF